MCPSNVDTRRIFLLVKTISYTILILVLLPCAPAIAQNATSERATQDYELHFTKGVAMFDIGEYDRAKSELTDALAAKPNDNQASLYLARTNNRVKGYAEAEALLLKLLERDPTVEGARFDLGVAQFNLQKYEQALDQFSQAVKEDPDKPLPYFYEGLTLNKLERYSQAPARFARASLIDPELTASANYQSGIAYFRANLRDEAEDAFGSVIAADPNSPLAVSAGEFLEQVKTAAPAGQKKKKPWDLSLMVSPQYDTNVILQAPGGRRPEDISRQQDLKTTYYGRGEYRFKETAKMSLGSSYSFYQSFHSELTQFDVQAHSPSLFMGPAGRAKIECSSISRDKKPEARVRSSIAIISPRPRISLTTVTSASPDRSPCTRISPLRATSSTRPPSLRASRVAVPAQHASGAPPKVEP